MRKNYSEVMYPDDSSGQRFKLLAEAAFEGIFVHNGYVILDANKQACKLFNYSRNRLIGTPLNDLILPSYHAKLARKIEKDVSTAYSVVALKGNGEPFSADIRGKSLYMSHGKIRIVAIRDTTKQKENEQRLIFQYKLATLFQSEKSEQYTIRHFLRLLCRVYQFEIGEFYRADNENQRMQMTATWYEKSHPEFTSFMEKSKGTVFSYGSGFPGIVAETGKPIWTDDYENSPFVRRTFLTTTKIRTINCIPFFMYGKIGGCYLLLSEKENVQPVNYLYSTVSSQLGQYLEAQESRKQLQFANNAVRAVPLLIYVTDKNGQVFWSNKGGSGQIFCSIGIEQHGSKMGETVRKILKKGIGVINDGGLLYRETVQCDKQSETEGPVYEVIITQLEKNRNKHSRYYTMTVADITEQKRMQKTLNRYSVHLEEQIHFHEQELSIAGNIQRGLLPEQPPAIEGWELAARARPAHSIGGDLYDFIRYSEKIYYIVMADISGKGMSAALLTSAAKAIVREKIKNGDTPGIIISQVNKSMYHDLSHLEMFITMFILKIDTENHILTYANAGHTRTIVTGPDGKNSVLLPATDMPLGILPDMGTATKPVPYLPGSSIVLYSDGFTEAANSLQELYGEDRFVLLIQKHCSATPEQQVSAIFDTLTNFSAKTAQSDDCTLVILKSSYIKTATILQPIPKEADRLLSLIEQTLTGYDPALVSDIQLIVMELFTNILSYSLGVDMETGKSTKKTAPVSYDMEIHEDHIELNFLNKGDIFDRSVYREPVLGEGQIGGYGLFLVRQLSDTLDYFHQGDENHWHIEKTFRRAVNAE